MIVTQDRVGQAYISTLSASAKSHLIELGFFSTSCYCATIVASLTWAFECNGDQESRSLESSSFWPCTGRAWIRSLVSTLHMTALNLHDRSSSIQVRRHYVPSRLSSTDPTSFSTTHRWLRTTINNSVSTICDVVSLCSQKVHTPWSNLLLQYAYCLDHDMPFVMPAVLILLPFIMSLFMLFDLTSMLGLFMIVYEIVMIYILVLIWKMLTFSTPLSRYQSCMSFSCRAHTKLYSRYRPEL